MTIEMKRRCSIYLGIMGIFRRKESKLVIKNWGLSGHLSFETGLILRSRFEILLNLFSASLTTLVASTG